MLMRPQFLERLKCGMVLSYYNFGFKTIAIYDIDSGGECGGICAHICDMTSEGIEYSGVSACHGHCIAVYGHVEAVSLNSVY